MPTTKPTTKQSKRALASLTVRYAWRSFTSMYRHQPMLVSIYCGLAILNVGSSVSSIFFVSRILQGIYTSLSGSAPMHASHLYLLLLYSVVFALIEQLSFQGMFIAERRSYLRYSGYIEQEYNEKTANLDTAYFEDQEFAGLLARVNGEINYKPANHAYQSLRVVQAMLKVLVPAAVIITFAPWMTLVIIAGSLPSIIAEFKLSKVQWGIWQMDSEAANLHYKLNWMLRGQDELQEVRLFGAKQHITKLIRALLETTKLKQDAAIRKSARTLLAARTMEVAVSFGLQLWILHKVISKAHGYTIATFTFYAAMIGQFSNSIGLFASTFNEFMEYNLYMTDYYQVMDTVNVVVDIDHPVRLKKTFKTIEFEHVSFRYKPDGKDVLRDVSFTLKHGDKLAIVGENGAGKSTLIRLLLRFYYPTTGRILVDGIDLKNIAIADYYAQIGVLFQTFNHYPVNAGENITIGDTTTDPVIKRLEAAAKDSGAHKIVSPLPKKYKTMLSSYSKGGVNLSGGQWQRIALARAFYRNAPLLILDEPTAAVDANSEYEIFENIRRNQAANTSIIISHRFSTVRQAQQIIVLDKGKVAEHGSHEQLMKQKGLYREMFDKQAAGYR